MFSTWQLLSSVTLILTLPCITTQQELDPEYLKNVSATRDACTEQHGLTADYVINVMKSTAALPNDDKLKCYYSCVTLKLGIMDETGDIKEDALKLAANEMFNDNVEADIVKNCDVPKEGDLCATAFKLMQCIHKEATD